MVPFLSRGHVIENSHLNFILKTLREKNKNTEGEKQKHCGSDLKTRWKRFKNTVGAIQKHNGSDSKTQWERETSPIVFLFFCVKFIPCSYK